MAKGYHSLLFQKSDHLMKASAGLKFLGVKLWPSGRTLTNRNLARIKNRLSLANVSSYKGLVSKHASLKDKKRFNWRISEKIDPCSF